jgi:hypothetical protein
MNRTELGSVIYNCVDVVKLKELTGLELVVGSVNNELYISLVNRETEERIKFVEHSTLNKLNLDYYIELLEKVSKLKSMGYTSLSTTELEKTINSILQLWEF